MSSEYLEFYQSEFSPMGLSGVVGGGPGEVLLFESINELLCPVDTNEYDAVTVPLFQYRKFWIKQVWPDTLVTIVIEFANTEHLDRISMASTLLHGSGNTALDFPEPDEPLTWASGKDATLVIGPGVEDDWWGIWIRQLIVSGDSADNLASINLRVIGA